MMLPRNPGLRIGPLIISTSRPARHPAPGENVQPRNLEMITVNKIYDYVRYTMSTTVLLDVPPELPSDQVAAVKGRVVKLVCMERSRKATGTEGLFEVGLNVVAKLRFSFCDAREQIIHRCSRIICLNLPPIVMLAPIGTRIGCESEESKCVCDLPQNGEISCYLRNRLVIESSARVKMLVPTFGFASPRTVSGVPETNQTTNPRGKTKSRPATLLFPAKSPVRNLWSDPEK